MIKGKLETKKQKRTTKPMKFQFMLFMSQFVIKKCSKNNQMAIGIQKQTCIIAKDVYHQLNPMYIKALTIQKRKFPQEDLTQPLYMMVHGMETVNT